MSLRPTLLPGLQRLTKYGVPGLKIKIQLPTSKIRKRLLGGAHMIIFKHVKYKIRNADELDGVLDILAETTGRVKGVKLQEILFPKDKDGFLLVFNCETIEIYHEWRKVCPPPPPGATDRYEVFLTREEYFAE